MKNRLRRPSTDGQFTRASTDDVLYELGTEAQARITTLIAVYVPDGMWTVPTAMTTADSGKTFTFGTDTDGAAIFALGHYRLYDQRADIPDTPLTEGVDFTVEGTLIRIPNNVTRSFSDGGTPWAQYTAPSNVVAAATQPTIPKVARMAMLSDWARRAAEYLDDSVKAAEQAEQFQSDWDELLAAVRTQAAGKGGPSLARRARASGGYR